VERVSQRGISSALPTMMLEVFLVPGALVDWDGCGMDPKSGSVWSSVLHLSDSLGGEDSMVGGIVDDGPACGVFAWSFLPRTYLKGQFGEQK
jgi:hypothetical protein